MNIVELERCHIPAIAALARHQHDRARKSVNLPDAPLPDLSCLVNGLGVVAMEAHQVVGFLGSTGPWPNQFGTQMPGVYSPLEAHGAVEENAIRIWQSMYQAAAERWVAAGAGWHAISLHGHEQTAQHALWQYGFGQRCADAVRPVEPLYAAPIPGISCCELSDGHAVQELRLSLARHMCQSPCFMVNTDDEDDMARWLNQVNHRQRRVFAAMAEGKPVAVMEVKAEGETYFTAHEKMANICGTFCAEAWRGKGVSRLLLDYVLQTLQREKYQYLGVDYETINPTAAGFWPKYFTPYTLSLVRRVDQL